jgi:hypothetical protein
LAWGGVAAAELLQFLAGPDRIPPFVTRLFAQQSADYSDLTNWFSANSGAGSFYDSCNKAMVSPFNNVNNGTYSPDDLDSIAGQGNLMANYSAQTGSPTLDACTQSCVMKNVPSPGSASQVLFTNPGSASLNNLYSKGQGYGYNATYGQVEGWCYVPNISTWNSSNYIYPLCANTSSYAIGQVASVLSAAATAYRNALRGGGSWALTRPQCTTLYNWTQALFAISGILAGVGYVAGQSGLLVVAGAAEAAPFALLVDAGVAYLIYREVCES